MSTATEINAEDLPVSASRKYFVGLDADENGALIDALPIITGRPLGITDPGLTLPNASYEGYILECTNAGTSNFTIPTHATEPWPTLAVVPLVRGTGTLTVVGAVGVTIVGNFTKLRAAGSMATLIKLGTNRWLVTGDTVAP